MRKNRFRHQAQQSKQESNSKQSKLQMYIFGHCEEIRSMLDNNRHRVRSNYWVFHKNGDLCFSALSKEIAQATHTPTQRKNSANLRNLPVGKIAMFYGISSAGKNNCWIQEKKTQRRHSLGIFSNGLLDILSQLYSQGQKKKNFHQGTPSEVPTSLYLALNLGGRSPHFGIFRTISQPNRLRPVSFESY